MLQLYQTQSFLNFFAFFSLFLRRWDFFSVSVEFSTFASDFHDSLMICGFVFNLFSVNGNLSHFQKFLNTFSYFK